MFQFNYTKPLDNHDNQTPTKSNKRIGFAYLDNDEKLEKKRKINKNNTKSNDLKIYEIDNVVEKYNDSENTDDDETDYDDLYYNSNDNDEMKKINLYKKTVDYINKSKKSKQDDQPESSKSSTSILMKIDVPGTNGVSLKKLDCDTLLSDEYLYKIRAYIDMVAGLYMCLLENRLTPLQTIPILIIKILDFNNIRINKTRFFKHPFPNPKDEYEPIEYAYNLDEDNEFLYLFINDEKIKTFCSYSVTPIPIRYECKSLPIQKFNPYKSRFNISDVEQLKLSLCNCVIVADRTAQHIITDIYHDLNHESIPQTEKTNYEFTKYGITIHSMFKICELDIDNNPKNSTNYNLISSKFW